MSSISTADVRRWFELRREKPATMASNLGRLSAMFSAAVRAGWRADNPVDGVERGAVQILTPRQCALALVWCARRRPDFLGWLVLGLFLGLRPTESRLRRARSATAGWCI